VGHHRDWLHQQRPQVSGAVPAVLPVVLGWADVLCAVPCCLLCCAGHTQAVYAAHHLHTTLSIACPHSCPPRPSPHSSPLHATPRVLRPQPPTPPRTPVFHLRPALRLYCRRFAEVKYLPASYCPADYDDMVCGGGTGENTCNGDSGACRSQRRGRGLGAAPRPCLAQRHPGTPARQPPALYSAAE
jgi:hypothetical protein